MKHRLLTLAATAALPLLAGLAQAADVPAPACEDIRKLRFSCDAAGTIRLSAGMTTTRHDGQSLLADIDHLFYDAPITGKKALVEVPGYAPGKHLVFLAVPHDCYPPRQVVCP